MYDYKIRLRLFFALGAVVVLSLLPNMCFSASMTEAEIRVAREKIVAEAKKYIGSPYVRGATGPDKFDCSGLIYYVSREAIGVQLPRTVKALYGYVKIISEDKLEAGDLVFFRTTGDGTISHVGLYIGNGQFISAVSDGPNTGVILSSVKENYWKTKYAGCGKFLGDSHLYNEASSSGGGGNGGFGGAENAKNSKSKNQGTRFIDKLFIDTSLTGDWSFFTEERLVLNFRGLTATGIVLYGANKMKPGIGLSLRWNAGVEAFQVPLFFAFYFNDYIKAYVGPVFGMQDCYSPDTKNKIKPSILPGIIGISFMTPSLSKGKVKVRFMQDINYSVYNNRDGAALPFLRAISSGLEFSTGLSVMFPVVF